MRHQFVWIIIVIYITITATYFEFEYNDVLAEEKSFLEDVFEVLPLAEDSATPHSSSEEEDASIETEASSVSPRVTGQDITRNYHGLSGKSVYLKSSPVSAPRSLQIYFYNSALQAFSSRGNHLLESMTDAGLQNLKVRVFGMQNTMTTGTTGSVFIDLPSQDSQLLLAVDQQQEIFWPTIHTVPDVFLDSNSHAITTLGQFRSQDFLHWLQKSSLTHNAELGHICGRIAVSHTKKPAYGYMVSLGDNQHGTLRYISHRGHPDASLSETSSFGAFCFFNIPPGAYILNITHRQSPQIYTQRIVWSKANYIHSLNIAVSAQPIEQKQLHSLVHPPAYSILQQDTLPISPFAPPIEQKQFYVLESTHAYTNSYQSPNTTTASSSKHPINIGMHVLVDTPQWEYSLHHIPQNRIQNKQNTLISLYARDTLQNLAQMIGIPYYPTYSTVITEHGISAENGDSMLQHILYGIDGELSTLQRWTTHQTAHLMRTFYWNVPSGQYLHVIKNNKGWVSSQIVHVWPQVHSILYAGDLYYLP